MKAITFGICWLSLIWSTAGLWHKFGFEIGFAFYSLGITILFGLDDVADELRERRK